MATTTPNFGWAVPTSSDLVKNGATAIETLGDAIDASLVDLKGGTTGQYLTKTSNTDMDFTWLSPYGYTAWTPTWTGLTVGNGTVTARYTQVGKTVRFDVAFSFGSTSAITAGFPSFTLPVNLAKTSVQVAGLWVDTGTQKYFNSYYCDTASICYLIAGWTGGNYMLEAGISGTVPFTWTTNDYFAVSGSYEVA